MARPRARPIRSIPSSIRHGISCASPASRARPGRLRRGRGTCSHLVVERLQQPLHGVERGAPAGDALAVVEAMKMENILKAERDGKVKKISAQAGDSLAVDAVIIEFA